MKVKGRVLDISYGIDSKPRLLLEIDREPGELPEDLLDIELKPHKEKRSLDANAYYWALTSQIAKVLRISNEQAHEMQLQKYGCFELDETGAAKWVVIPEGQKAPEGVHLFPTDHIVKMQNKKGVVIGNVFIRLRGSHTYNTQEMSTLIDGTIEDAKELGIDTISTEEKRRMLEMWGKRFEK